MSDTVSVQEWLDLLGRHGSLLKARRALLKERRWTEEDWYARWQHVGDALEVALRYRSRSP